MSDSDAVSELVLEWEDLRRQGKLPALAELCRDQPHLTDEVAQRIRRIESMERLLRMDSHPGSAADTIDLHGTIASAGPPVVRPPSEHRFPKVPGYEILEELG